MTNFKVGDRVRVRKGQEKMGGSTNNELRPGEYTILRVGGEFVTVDLGKPEFYGSRFELIPPSLAGIREGDVVKVATNNGLSGTFTVSAVGDTFVASTEWEADILLDNIVSIEVVTKAKPPLPDEPRLHAVVMGGSYRPFVRHRDGWKITGDSGGRSWTWAEIVNEFRFENSFTLLFNGSSNKVAPKVVTDIALPKSPEITLYGINGVNAKWHGNWAEHFELVTDDIKVGDYVSIDKTDIYGPLAKGTVESITPSEPVVLVRSDSGQTYARKPSELTPVVKTPVDPEPGVGTMVTWPGVRFVRQDQGWVKLDHRGRFDSFLVRTWDELNARGSGRNKVIFSGKRIVIY